MKAQDSIARYLPICAGMMALTAFTEYSMGRLPFCKCGIIRLWSGDIWSNQNSQQLLDPYSFTHVLHGVIWYALIWLILGNRVPAGFRLVLAVGIECGWEILENSSFIINRYRAGTISLDYYGDSILNSMGDILSMVLGFALARRLPARITAVFAVALDLFLLWWIRDNLTVNIIMLIHPIEAIRHWQILR